MTAKDEYGYAYIYSNGVISEKPLDRRRLIISYFYRENDGWSFIHKGSEKTLYVKFGRNIDSCDLEEILGNKLIDKEVKKAVRAMITNGKKEMDYKIKDRTAPLVLGL